MRYFRFLALSSLFAAVTLFATGVDPVAAQTSGGGGGATSGGGTGAAGGASAGAAQGGGNPSAGAAQAGGNPSAGAAQGTGTPAAGAAQGAAGGQAAGAAQGPAGAQSPAAGAATGQSGTPQAGQNNANRNPRGATGQRALDSRGGSSRNNRNNNAPGQGAVQNNRGNRSANDLDNNNNRGQGNARSDNDRSRADVNRRSRLNPFNDGAPGTADDINPDVAQPNIRRPQQSQPGSGIGLPGNAQPGSGVGLPNQRSQDGVANPSLENTLFGDPTLGEQMGFTGDEFSQIGQQYSQLMRQYEQAQNQLPADLTNEERNMRLAQLRNEFNQQFAQQTDQLFQSPLQRERFRQLQMQYQGFDAFNDPQLQERLNLSAEQIVRLNRLNEQWQNELQAYNQQTTDQAFFSENPNNDNVAADDVGGRQMSPAQQFRELQRLRWQQIYNILDDNQRYEYFLMTGAPHSFPMSAYVRGSATSNQGRAPAPQAGAQQLPGESGDTLYQQNSSTPQGASTPQGSSTPQGVSVPDGVSVPQGSSTPQRL